MARLVYSSVAGGCYHAIEIRASLIRILVYIACAFLVYACAGNNQVAPVSDRKVSSGKSSTTSRQRSASNWVTVQKGDTLFSISFVHGYDFKTVARINGIKSPYTIYPGQRIRLKPYRSAKPSSKSEKKKRKKKYIPPSNKNTNTRSTRTRSNVTWKWPTSGRVLRGYSSKAPRKKGIGITGKASQSILASASGKVVYSGNGLIGYGNLVIIKHDETFLSAYAHNHKVYVKEGQRVKRGEKIALMGLNENNTPMLHFEIRRHGKPVNPLAYLPKK